MDASVFTAANIQAQRLKRRPLALFLGWSGSGGIRPQLLAEKIQKDKYNQTNCTRVVKPGEALRSKVHVCPRWAPPGGISCLHRNGGRGLLSGYIQVSIICDWHLFPLSSHINEASPLYTESKRSLISHLPPHIASLLLLLLLLLMGQCWG